jgi:uncharacterized membrane protein
MKRTAAIVSLALALASCGPETSKPAAPAAPANAAAPGKVSDFSQPITARGNEPFWALIIDGVSFTLKRPDLPDLVATAPGARIQPGQASWTATAPDGRVLKVSLYVSECSDGMSDLDYPMSAEVELANETLRGCAAKTSELPPAGRPPA